MHAFVELFYHPFSPFQLLLHNYSIMDQRGLERWAAQGHGPTEGKEEICHKRGARDHLRRCTALASRTGRDAWGRGHRGSPYCLEPVSSRLPPLLPSLFSVSLPLLHFPLSLSQDWAGIPLDFPSAPQMSRPQPSISRSTYCMAPASSSKTRRRHLWMPRRTTCS